MTVIVIWKLEVILIALFLLMRNTSILIYLSRLWIFEKPLCKLGMLARGTGSGFSNHQTVPTI